MEAKESEGPEKPNMKKSAAIEENKVAPANTAAAEKMLADISELDQKTFKSIEQPDTAGV